MKLALVISSLSSGGSERVMTLLANYWVNKGWSVTIITLSGRHYDFYSLDSRVNRVGLNCQYPSKNIVHAINATIRRLILLRQSIKQLAPDVVLSFIDEMNVITLIATIGLKYPVLISERIDPRRHKMGKMKSYIRDIIYSRADKLVVQSEAVQQWATNKWPHLPNTVIYNPVLIPENNTHHEFLDQNFNWCIAIGRLSQQKGFDLLLSAFAIVRTKLLQKTWKLVILGEGELRKTLESQVGQLGIKGSVLMPGRVKNPCDYLNQANIFILSSRFEGFPNALLEAMACGLPVIATDCPSGPGEIVKHEINGLLVKPENINDLANAIHDLISNDIKREKLADRSVASVTRFGIVGIVTQWERVLECLVEKIT